MSTSIAPMVIEDANTVAQRNATSPQAWHIYNTYTNSTNWERAIARWAGNELSIGVEVAGTGRYRPLNIYGGWNDGIRLYTGTQQSANLGESHSIFAKAVGIGYWTAAAPHIVFRLTDGVPVVQLSGATQSAVGAAIEFVEMAARPAVPAANNARIFLEDDGTGKSRLMVQFASGAAVQIAIQP